MKLKDQIAVVTGGSRGIGRAVCVALAKQGCNVVVNYCHGAEPAEQTAALCRAEGVQAVTVQADVSTAEGCKALFDAAAETFGRVDVLVNNAGITRDNLILRLTEQDFDAVLDTNLKSAFLCCKEAARRMVRQRYGRIVNLSSVVALRGNAGQTNYAASKAGLIGLTKSLAKERPEAWAIVATPLLWVMAVVLTPVNFLFTQWKKLLRVLLRHQDDDGITEEELMGMVDQAETEGSLDQHESDLIRNAIEFNDMEVSEILTPRVDLEALADTATMEEAAAMYADSGFSRLPIYHDSIDNIIGVLHEKDFYAAYCRGVKRLSELKGSVLYTTETARISDLLRQLQQNKVHMAVVVDEYGGTQGIVTMEDIMEELVGEIWDEHDEVIEEFRKQSDGSYLVACSADLDDLYDLFDMKPSEEYDASTVSGWVMEEIGRVPDVGDRFQADGLDVCVTRVEHRRVMEIRVRPLPPEKEEPEKAHAHSGT